MRHDSVTFLQSGIICIIISFLQLMGLRNSSKPVKGRDNTGGCARQDAQDFFFFLISKSFITFQLYH